MEEWRRGQVGVSTEHVVPHVESGLLVVGRGRVHPRYPDV